MSTFVRDASALIAGHEAWAGPVIGLIAFGESMPVIGAFLPATVFLVAAGGLIASGAMQPLPVLAGASLGAILGDTVAFHLGSRLGARLPRGRTPAKRARLIAATRLMIRRHGAPAILLGRFAGPLRAFVPMVAGMMRMPERRFQPANCLSAPVWAAVSIAPGYLTDKGLQHAAAPQAPLLFGVVAAAGVVALVLAWTAGLRRRGRALHATRPGPDLTPP